MPSCKSELGGVCGKENELVSFPKKSACLGRESMSCSEGKEVKIRKGRRDNGSVENWINVMGIVTRSLSW